jgi:hypothetical protein
VPQEPAEADLFDQVVTALRLFKPSTISWPGYFEVIESWLMGGTMGTLRSQRPMRGIYALKAEDIQPLAELWRQLRSEGFEKRPWLSVATKRFSFAMDRLRWDDQLVDFMIAAEALFLSDMGGDKYQGEKRFRLALRAGHFVESPSYSQREVYRMMRRFYDARSTVVHGGAEDTKNPPNVAELEELIRLAIQKSARIAAARPDKSPLLDNDSALLSDRI